MTPSKLKEQLMEEWFNRSAPYQCELLGSLIDIILSQQRALAQISLTSKEFTDEPRHFKEIIADETLAATNAKLKALGCECE